MQTANSMTNFCASSATKDPWGGRLGSMGSLATDGYGVLQDIITGLSRESGYDTWKDVFTKIDEDQSGMLDADEMKRALSQVSVYTSTLCLFV